MSGMLYENYEPDGAGMSKKQARRSAIISGLPASQMEVAAQAAKEDFQNRTLATKQQAYADQQANIVGGISGMAKLAGTQYKNRALDDKQAQRLQQGGAPGVEQRSGDQHAAALQQGMNARQPQQDPYGPAPDPNDPFIQLLLGLMQQDDPNYYASPQTAWGMPQDRY